MRSKISVFLVVSLVVSICALTILAQEKEQQAKAFYVREVAVRPSGLMNFIAGVKELVAQETEHKFPFPIYAYGTEDFMFYFLAPLGEGTIEDFWKAWGEFQVKIGQEQGQKIQKLMEGTTEYHNDGFVVLRPDLSYTPENPRLKPEEANFRNWIFYYIEPGKEKETEEVAKKLVALYKSKNIPDGWDTYEVIMGKEAPLYVIVDRAKNAADYYSTDYSKLLGEEAKALSVKSLPLLRKLETKQGWFRPDLSYIPKEK